MGYDSQRSALHQHPRPGLLARILRQLGLDREKFDDAQGLTDKATA
jgi:hypothetical protein